MSRAAKAVVIGLDGFSWSLARRLIGEGLMPNLKALSGEGELVQMDSVYPTISGVAWSAFQTGKNPGKFGLYGFAELTPDLDLFIPNSTHLKAKTIWEIFSENGLKVAGIGVPNTYPPRRVNGVLVGGFLSPSLPKAVYPPDFLPRLIRLGYRLDIDPVKARESLGHFKAENLEVFEGRTRTLLYLLDRDWWDLLVFHFMDTDRMGHFMFRFSDGSAGAEEENNRYWRDFFSRLDDMLGLLRARLGDRQLILLSDHGFCRLRYEVQLNRWLSDEGYLELSRPAAHDLDFKALSPRSRAFSLVPGRIYLLRGGEWEIGSLDRAAAERTREEIIASLERLEGPSGEKVCRKVMRREEVFSGPYLSSAPDIVIEPEDGFDFKAGLKQTQVFNTGPLSGMHTYSDALLYVRGRRGYDRRPSIIDLAPFLMRSFGLSPPSDMDGVGLFPEPSDRS